MRRRDVVLHTIEFCFGQVIAGAVAPHRLQREAGERVVIVSGEHPDPLTVLPCNRVRQDSHGVEGVAGLLQDRSEEHTSELQSQFHLVCRLLLEKKKSIALGNATTPLAVSTKST